MEEFAQRRKKIFENIQDNSMVILFSGVSKNASGDAKLPFVVNSNFFYLTNIKQENSILLLIKTLGEEKEYLFVDYADENKQKWIGKKLEFDEIKNISGVKSVQHVKDLNAFIELALSSQNNQYGKISNIYVDKTPEIKIKASYSTKDFAEALENK